MSKEYDERSDFNDENGRRNKTKSPLHFCRRDFVPIMTPDGLIFRHIPDSGQGHHLSPSRSVV